jgi:RNA polymerase sigma-70 factor (ECF subfamily)
MKASVSDTDLLHSFLTLGDESAYDALVTLYYRDVGECIFHILRKHLYGYDPKVIRNEAADICHDFLMDKFQSILHKYDKQRGSIKTWVIRCASNYALDRLRSKKKEGYSESLHVNEEEWKTYYALREIVGDALHNPHHDRETEELLGIVQRYIQKLPEHYRRSLLLRLEGLTNEEIARQLAIPVGTVKSHISRATQIIRDRLRGDGYL